MPNIPFTTDIEVAQSRFPLAMLIQCGLALSLFIFAVLLPPLRLFSDPQPYLPLHITLEFLSIAAALMIFTVGWFSFGHERSARFQILACAFLAVALLDFVHTLSYAGMPDLVTPNSLEKAINLWLPARLISALALMATAALSPQTALSRWGRGWLLAVTLTVIGVVITMGLLFPDIAPRTFISGQGLTPFKIAVESLVAAIYALALIRLIRDWRRDRDRFRALLITGIWILLMGELSLTIYATVTDLHNLLGHLGKTWGEGFVFWAIYGQALEEPHRRLQQSERLLVRTEAQTQELLRENQLLLNSAFVGIFYVQNRRFIWVNRCAETMFGYAPGELDDVSAEVIYPNYAAFQRLGERAYPAIHRGESFAGDMELVRKDGRRFWCLMRGQALNPQQPQDGSIWIMEDVTERRRARQALEDAANLYRAIFESRTVIKVLINPDNGQIVDANQAAAEFYGLPREELRQLYACELSATPGEELLTLFADLKTGRASLTQEYQTRHRRADGELCQVGIHLDLIQREDRRFLLATVLDLTERKRTEAAIQANLALQRELLEAIPTPVFYKDVDGRYQSVNRAFAEFFGVSEAELIGKTVYDRWPHEAANLFYAKDQALFQNPGVQIYEAQLKNPQGELRDVVFHKATLHYPDGRLRGLIGFILDITERKAAEAALQHSELRFRTLFTASKVAMLLIDPGNGDIVDANPAASDYYGYPVKRLRRMQISAINILTPEQSAEEMRLAQQEQRSHFHFQHRLASGDVRDVEVHSGPLELDGRPLLYSIIHDTTERRRLADERRKLSQAVEQNPASIVITDLEGRIEYANRQFLQITGYAEAEVLGQNPRLLQSGETSAEEYAALWNAITDGQTWRGILHNRKKNGDLFWELAHISPIFDDQGRITHYLGVKENITALKAAEDALRESEERLQQVLHGANDGFWDWNIGTGDVLFSPRWAEMLGYDLAEIEPHVRAWEQRVHPDDLPRCQAALQAHFAGETTHYQCDHRMQAKNGEWRWILDRGKVTARDAQGQPLRMAGTHSDITERHRMEEVLRVSLAEVKRHDAQMITLNRMNDLLLSCETHEEAYAIIAGEAGRLFAGCIGGLAIAYQAAAPELRMVATWGDANALPTTFPLHDCWALRRGELHEITDLAQGAQCRHFSHPPTSAYLCIPLTVRSETFGLLHLSIGETPTENQFQELRTLSITMSESIKLALSNIKLREALREQAIRDALTGLFNRRYLDETLPRELHRCQRQGEPLAAAMLDVDHFKHFNDAYGHEAGDTVLRVIGELLNRSLRSGDIACRYGGEELAVILPSSTLDDARIRLDRLRQAIMQLRVIYQGEELPAITVSIGVAAATEEQEVDAVALLTRADDALYQAKADGRNRVVVA
jgi:diguanylate cyclase (GGDEF)-like protein/PAS domain S-box-containing protein